MQQLQTVINATELWQHTRRKKKEASRGAMATRPVSTVVRSCGFSASHNFLFVAIGMNCLGTMASWAQESSSIAKQAQNPIANLISVPLENDFDPQTGYKREDSYVQEVKPVVPFRLSNDWNLITRTIIPIIQVPDLTPNVSGVSGLGDVELSLFLSPAKVGPVIWGVGPAISIPTATEDILGTKKLSVGPA